MKSWLFAALAILCWSTAATAFKLSLGHIGFIDLVFWSSLFSTVVLFVIALLSKRLHQFSAWKAKDVLFSAGLGALNPAIYYLLLFKAYSLLDAQQAQVLNFIWPVVLTLLSVLFYKERLSVVGWFAMLVSFSGVVLIASGGKGLNLNSADAVGVVFALVSAFFWALYWLANRNDQQDPVLRLMLNFVFGTVWVGVVIFVQGSWQLPNIVGLVGASYVALFEMSLAFLFWLSALKASKNVAQLSNLIFITPFLSLMVIWLVLDEEIKLVTIGGLVLIILGIMIQRRFQSIQG